MGRSARTRIARPGRGRVAGRGGRGTRGAALVAVLSAALAGALAPVALSQGSALSASQTAGQAQPAIRLTPRQRKQRLARRGARGLRGLAGPQGAPGPAGEGGAPGLRAQVENVTVNWQNDAWQSNSTAGFAIPGIGLGQIVCTPPDNGVAGTTWLRVYPFNQNDYVTMWVLRQQDGLAPTVREAKYYPGAGIQDFNEGFNTVNTGANPYGQPTSTGAFQGLITDHGRYGGSGAAPKSTSFRLSFTWDFTNQSSARCYVAAKFVTGG